MSSLSEKALQILQASGKTKFTTLDLITNGFSVETANAAIKELEDADYIFIIKTYINENVAFELL